MRAMKSRSSCEESLEDPAARKDGLLRVVDEDEDYLYPASWFLRIDLRHEVEEEILETAHS